MTFDAIYGNDVEQRIRNGEAALRERLLPEVEWNATEDSRLVEELLSACNAGSDQAA